MTTLMPPNSAEYLFNRPICWRGRQSRFLSSLKRYRLWSCSLLEFYERLNGTFTQNPERNCDSHGSLESRTPLGEPILYQVPQEEGTRTTKRRRLRKYLFQGSTTVILNCSFYSCGLLVVSARMYGRDVINTCQ